MVMGDDVGCTSFDRDWRETWCVGYTPEAGLVLNRT